MIPDKYGASVSGRRPFDHCVCCCQRSSYARLPTARGSVTPDRTCHGSPHDQSKADIALGIIRKWFDQDGVDAMQNVGNSSIALGQGTLSRRRKRSLITTVGSAELIGKMARQPRNRLLHETIYRSPFVQDRRMVPRAH
jgi:hypothetical protein